MLFLFAYIYFPTTGGNKWYLIRESMMDIYATIFGSRIETPYLWFHRSKILKNTYIVYSLRSFQICCDLPSSWKTFSNFAFFMRPSIFVSNTLSSSGSRCIIVHELVFLNPTVEPYGCCIINGFFCSIIIYVLPNPCCKLIVQLSKICKL